MEVHFVCKNTKYATLQDALKHFDGLAVLGFFFKVGSIPNEPYQLLFQEAPIPASSNLLFC